jgi:hypothetical protein
MEQYMQQFLRDGQQLLPEISPLIIGTAAFIVGLCFAWRERAQRRARDGKQADQTGVAA